MHLIVEYRFRLFSLNYLNAGVVVRTLNVRLALIILVAIIVGGTGIGVIHYFQQIRNAGFFLEQAELAKQELDDAKKEKNTENEAKAQDKQLRNLVWYLSFKPNDLDVLEQMGMIQADRVVDIIQTDHFLDTKSFSQAYTSLDKVVREDYTRNKARRKLIDLLILGGRFSDAREHINVLLKGSPDDPELWQLLGQSEEAVHEYDKAQSAYEKAIEYSPKQIDSYVRLAAVLRGGLEKQNEADACMKKLVENNSKSGKAFICLGMYLQSYVIKEEATAATNKKKYEPIYFMQCTDAKDETMKTAEKALELSPDDMDALGLASRSAMALGDMEKARKYAEQNMDLHKDSPTVYINLAEILMLSKEQDKNKAIEILDRGLKETNSDARILWFKANYLVDDRNLDAAKEIIQKLESKQFQKPLIEYLQGRISFAQKDWADAARRFESVRPFLSAYPRYLLQADVSLGYSYGQLHNVDQQIAAYQRVLSVNPFYAPARQGLTDAYLAAGRVDDAVGEYATLIRMNRIPPSGLISFASVLIRQNLQQDSKDQKWEQVQKVLDEAEKANPDSSQITLLRTEVLHAQNRDEDAEKLLQNAHQKNPKELLFWNAMVTIAALQKKWDQAEKVLADYQQQMGDSADLRLARSEYLLTRYTDKVGEHLKQLNEKLDAFSDADKIRLWNGLLTIARRSGDNQLIKYYVDLLAQKDVNNLEVHFLRLEQAANNQDLAALEDALKDVVKVEGEGQPLGLFGHARLLVLKAKDGNAALLDEAIQDLLQARELRSTWSRIPLFLGTIYDQQHKLDQALKNYMLAINMGEHNPGVVRRSVQLLFQNKRYTEADKLLHQLDRLQTPFTPELTKLWVQLLIQQGEFDLAVSKARQAVSEKSNDYNEHLWLGQILGIAARRAQSQNRSKDFQDLSAEAEKSLRRAVDLKSDVAETWVALVEFLSSVDKSSEAEELINKASGKIPADQAALALAQCYEAVEKNDQALEQYKLALAAKPDDQIVVRNVADFYQRIGKTVEAEALYNRILQGKVKADAGNISWARRQLAQIIAAKGGLVNMEAARKLIEENLTMAANSADDLRIKARFYAVDPRSSMKEEAIATLQKMMEGQQATPEDRYNLAILYLSTEKQLNPSASAGSKSDTTDKNSSAWINASTILRNLIASQNSEPRYLALYAKALLDHGEVSGAELYLNKLVKDFSNAAATVVLQAEFLTRRNQYEEALDLIKSFVDLKNAIPADRSKRIRMMAETIEQLAEKLKSPDQKTIAERYIRTAEMFYRQYVDEHPSQSLDLVMFFSRQGQPDEALNILEQTWQNSEPIVIAQVCMNLSQNGKAPKEIMDRVEKVLADARVKFEDHPAILLSLGDLRVLQDRYTEAETFYRNILEKNPGHSLTLNNLAVLLSIQGKKLDEALTLINKAIEISGPLPSMMDTRACVYIAQGNAEKALADMDEAVAAGTTPVRLFHQAQALSLANQKYAASSTMQRALDAGLKKESLQTPEKPAFEKLQKLAKELASPQENK